MKAQKNKKTGKLSIKVKKGALHKDLGIASDKKIPATDLTVKKGDSPLEVKRKTFAKNAKSWNHKG